MSLIPLIERIDTLISNHASVSDMKAALATLHDNAEAVEQDHTTLKASHAALKEEHAKVKSENTVLLAENAALKNPPPPSQRNTVGTPLGF